MTTESLGESGGRRWWRVLLLLGLVAAAGVVVGLVWLNMATNALRSMERIALPDDDVRGRLGVPEFGAGDGGAGGAGVEVDEDGAGESSVEAAEDGGDAGSGGGSGEIANDVLDDPTTVLIIGSDAREGLGGARADVIILGVLPGGGKEPALVSLPRDLWVANPCTGSHSRINAGLNGCGERATGPELLTVMVEDFTGLRVDHYAKLDFDGFTEMVDTVGGVQVCVDRPMRERDLFELPAGCSRLDGEEALAWVRSRKTQELVDGSWRTVPGVSDLERNRRQQDLILQVFSRMASRGSLGKLTEISENLARVATVDDGFRVTTSARMAWRLRDVDRDDIVRIEVPVEHHTTSGGAMVLLPTEPFSATLRREHPGYARE